MKSPENCFQNDDLQAFVDGELPPLRKSAVENHIGSCSACRARVDAFRKVDSLFREACKPGAEDRVNVSKVDRVMRSLPAVTEQPGSSWRDLFLSLKPVFAFGAALVLLIGVGLFNRTPAPPGTGLTFFLAADQGKPFLVTGNGLPWPGEESGKLERGSSYRLPAQKTARLSCGPRTGMDIEISGPAIFVPETDGLKIELGSVVCSLDEPHPPFRVSTPFGDVQSVGTRFSVVVKPEEMTVDLQKGKVKVVSKKGERLLNTGEQIRIGSTGDIEAFAPPPKTGSETSSPVPFRPVPTPRPTTGTGEDAAGSLNQSY